jgi:hypothetical protein
MTTIPGAHRQPPDVDENADGATPNASSVAEPIPAPVPVTEQQVVDHPPADRCDSRRPRRDPRDLAQSYGAWRAGPATHPAAVCQLLRKLAQSPASAPGCEG